MVGLLAPPAVIHRVNVYNSILNGQGQTSILDDMKWVVGALILLVVAAVMRRILRLGKQAVRRAGGLLPLGADRSAVYQPIAREIETQAAILAISLNDAMEERGSGHDEIAWRLVRLSASEWDRLAEIVVALLNAVAKHLPAARVVVPARGMAAHRFKSQIMIDYVRLHELLDQLVFRSKLRFQMQVRVLRRAAETLTTEFRRSYRYAERTEDRSPELWNRLDLYFHDFDLVAKETLLAFRAFLVCLPHSALAAFAADLSAVVQRGVRSASISIDR